MNTTPDMLIRRIVIPLEDGWMGCAESPCSMGLTVVHLGLCELNEYDTTDKVKYLSRQLVALLERPSGMTPGELSPVKPREPDLFDRARSTVGYRSSSREIFRN